MSASALETSDAPSSAPCTLCPPATYMADPSATFCWECEEGFYCPLPGGADEFGVSCGMGHYCPSGVAAPIPCPPHGSVVDGLVSIGPAWDFDKAICYGHCFYLAVQRADGLVSSCF